MASMGGGHLDAASVERTIRNPRLVNSILKTVCRAEALPISGNKSELQSRLVDKIRLYARTGDFAKFNRLKGMLESPGQIHQPFNYYPPGPASPMYPPEPVYRPEGIVYRAPQQHANLDALDFRTSPFYEILRKMGTKVADAMEHHRNSVKLFLKTSDFSILEGCPADPAKRVMVFCSGEQGALAQDVAFPNQCELKVNSDTVKASMLKGVKNKPGSTKPVDITDMLRFKPLGYTNTIEMTYALTTKRFTVSLYAVKITSTSALRDRLATGKKISKESVLNEMRNKAKDPDIVLSASVLSLKCPLSYRRIELPVRSTLCRHNQCFNAESYLQLQEQAPIWQCPLCNKPAAFESLVVDEYVKDILSKTARAVEQVTIEPDGEWHEKVETTVSLDESSDDENHHGAGPTRPMNNSRVASLQNGNLSSLPRTPPGSVSRDASATVPRHPSGKRPISEVIDLTFSDDDEPISRAPKRHNTGPGFDTLQNMYAMPYCP